MDSIDIELCRRLADLAVFFLIELISRFLKATLLLFRQFLGKQPQRHRMPFLVARSITFACLVYEVHLFVEQLDLRQCLPATFANGFRRVG